MRLSVAAVALSAPQPTAARAPLELMFTLVLKPVPATMQAGHMERELDKKKTQSLVAITVCMSMLIASLAVLVVK